MKKAGKTLRLGVILILLLAGGVVVWILSGEPRHNGRPVSHWATHYSPELYPQGTSPRMPSRKGLEALREMGPGKAAAALVVPLSRTDTAFSQRYRSVHPRLPTWYQEQFPLGLTRQELGLMALGAAEFLDQEYQTALVPFLISYLEEENPARQQAACELLAQMPAAAAPALPALDALAQSSNPDVRDAARIAIHRIANTRTAP